VPVVLPASRGVGTSTKPRDNASQRTQGSPIRKFLMPIMMGPFASLKFLTLIYAISAIAVLPIRDVAPGSLTPDGRAAKSGIVVVQCSRATGRVAPRRRLRESGIAAGEDLSPQKARVLLMLMLLTATDIATVQQAYRTY
jgi:hypothetical protein